MKVQQFGKPMVNLSWIIKTDSYAKEKFKENVLDTDRGKLQLAETILMLIEQGMEIRLGTDGYCLILEANLADDDYSDACYQYIDDNHFVGELNKDGSYPEYYPEAVGNVIKDVVGIIADNLPQSVDKEFNEAKTEIYEKYSKHLKYSKYLEVEEDNE